MNTEPNLENESGLRKGIESPDSRVESNAEVKESDLDQGAQMLETPPAGGNFLLSLQAFRDWVKKLFAR